MMPAASLAVAGSGDRSTRDSATAWPHTCTARSWTGAMPACANHPRTAAVLQRHPDGRAVARTHPAETAPTGDTAATFLFLPLALGRLWRGRDRGARVEK